jgi:hypothetical protein
MLLTAILALFVIGPGAGVILALTVRAIRRRSLTALWPAQVIALAVGLAFWLAYWDVTYWVDWELGARVTPENLLGVYRHGDDRLELRSGWAFDHGHMGGSWEVVGGCLNLQGQAWTVARRSGRLMLLPYDCETDSDEWNKYAAFARESPAPAR